VLASTATIEQLARDTVQIPDAGTALRALGALRHELDQVERELVARALRDGASWSQIARALGVSKQAAHRRHRHLTEQAFDASGATKLPATSEALRSIQHAREEAKRLGQPAIGTEHLLLGILRCQQSHAAKALNALGVTHQAASARMQPTMPGIPLPPDRDSQPRPVVGQDNGVSPHARRIVKGSLREALKRHADHIDVEHLLLALLTDSRNGAMQTLEALNVSPAHLRRQLEQELAVSEAQKSAIPGPSSSSPPIFPS
jgi:ATP-dependent Clp protease ATP-binding subunit ClpA